MQEKEKLYFLSWFLEKKERRGIKKNAMKDVFKFPFT